MVDDDLSIVGSFNMDMRSVYLDTELMLVIDSKEVNVCNNIWRVDGHTLFCLFHQFGQGVKYGWMLVIDSKEVNAQLRGLLARYEDECAIILMPVLRCDLCIRGRGD